MKTRVVLKIGSAKLPERSIFGNVGNVRDIHPYARGYSPGLHGLLPFYYVFRCTGTVRRSPSLDTVKVPSYSSRDRNLV